MATAKITHWSDDSRGQKSMRSVHFPTPHMKRAVQFWGQATLLGDRIWLGYICFKVSNLTPNDGFQKPHQKSFWKWILYLTVDAVFKIEAVIWVSFWRALEFELFRPTSHTRLTAHDHHTSSTLIGGKGGGSPSSLRTTLEGPTEHVNARWM